jgi:hypothetical protein
MTLKVALLGAHPLDHDYETRQSVILRSLDIVSDAETKLVGVHAAELIIIYPYKNVFSSTVQGALASTFAKAFRLNHSPEMVERIFRRSFGIKDSARILFISPENLDRNPWIFIGRFARFLNWPRLTSWPPEIDPDGFRYPHWWNFVNWSELKPPSSPLPNRFGMNYELETLCSASEFDISSSSRENKAVWITNHLDFPRNAIFDRLSEKVHIDLLTNVPYGEKYRVLLNYKYCVTTENSVGYGYETEKVPDAITAGCIPVGYVGNPLGDFNPSSYFLVPPIDSVDSIPPLLRQRPNLTNLFNYLSSRLFDIR